MMKAITLKSLHVFAYAYVVNLQCDNKDFPAPDASTSRFLIDNYQAGPTIISRQKLIVFSPFQG